jgi:Polyketide cyclase / dehydrase and lipid transport
MKPVDVLTEIDISRPVDVVAAFAADPDTAPIWYRNIQSVEWRTESPLRVGTVVAFVARFLGRRLAYDYEVVEHEPGVRLVMRTKQGPFPMETTYEWAGHGARTHMTLRNRGVPRGFSRLTSMAMAPAMRRANRKDLAALKAILESQDAPPLR